MEPSQICCGWQWISIEPLKIHCPWQGMSRIAFKIYCFQQWTSIEPLKICCPWQGMSKVAFKICCFWQWISIETFQNLLSLPRDVDIFLSWSIVAAIDHCSSIVQGVGYTRWENAKVGKNPQLGNVSLYSSLGRKRPAVCCERVRADSRIRSKLKGLRSTQIETSQNNGTARHWRSNAF